MFETLGCMFTERSRERFRTLANRKEVSLYFFINYLSYESPHLARKFNRLMFKIKENFIWDLVFFHLPKKTSFQWNKGYIKKGKKDKVPEEFKKKVMKHFHWSEREWVMHKPIILQKKELYADLVGLDNRTRKELEIVQIKVPKIDRPIVRQKGCVGLERCKRCKRPLTYPKSVIRKYGAKCWNKVRKVQQTTIERWM